MRSRDKREYGRVPVLLDVTQSSKGRLSTVRATNLGYGGMQVTTLGPGAQPGDSICLEFLLPVTRKRVLAAAEVVYRTRGVAGLRFSFVPHPMKRSLEDYVSTQLAGSWFS